MTSHGPRPIPLLDLDWQDAGRCRDADPELFFPISDTDPVIELAKRICRRCPVQAACLKWAVDNGEEFGIFGGRTARQRRKYGTGPMPAERTVAPTPKPVRPTAVIEACAKPTHKPSDLRKRKGRGNSYYCQACAADRKRKQRSLAEAVA